MPAGQSSTSPRWAGQCACRGGPISVPIAVLLALACGNTTSSGGDSNRDAAADAGGRGGANPNEEAVAGAATAPSADAEAPTGCSTEEREAQQSAIELVLAEQVPCFSGNVEAVPPTGVAVSFSTWPSLATFTGLSLCLDPGPRQR